MGSSPEISVIGLDSTWIEGEATRQLERTAELPGMVRVAGMPDLHPGRGTPIGAAFFSTGTIYPYLVGNDIGCGMGLWQIDLKLKKAKLDKWERRIRNAGLDGPWDGNASDWLHSRGVEPSGHEASLGTVGGGNHFAEILRVHEVIDDGATNALGIDTDRFLLLVHSGSRGFGEEILRHHVDRFTDGGLAEHTEEAKEYVERHNHAIQWASANRDLVAHRVGGALGFERKPLLDVTHNSVVPAAIAGTSGWLHRKGAAPTDLGIVPVPGSRGTATYLLEPFGDGVVNCHSVAHGAGRKWKRSEAKARLRKRFSPENLTRTKLGGRVVCDNRDLLYEEAPEAYKDVDTVVQALVDAKVARVVAVLHPVLTYKVARS